MVSVHATRYSLQTALENPRACMATLKRRPCWSRSISRACWGAPPLEKRIWRSAALDVRWRVLIFLSALRGQPHSLCLQEHSQYFTTVQCIFWHCSTLWIKHDRLHNQEALNASRKARHFGEFIKRVCLALAQTESPRHERPDLWASV